MSLFLLASASTAQHAAGSAQNVTVTSLLVQLVVGLGLVLGLIAVAARVLRGRVGQLKRSSAPLSVLGRQSLGKGVQVAIVRAGAETYVLGITSHQVSRIGYYNETSAEDILSVDDQATRPAAGAPVWQSAMRQLKEKTVRRA